ncbi:hypothetical protein PU634_01080 [Oceanimonas pelagia]|uniref:Uncharacterized protein n=1 Tax=Oceanimonas pelagia TaxID=3028314 RepID=A0AA50QC76_9GAMM|nr:hypothetical protein [Oceanimonas pelagia]WMC10987.1 hypothetical protein PU634_01080 [Oceanimonas pelagia]
MTAHSLTLTLSQELAELFEQYEALTRVSAEQYVQQLVEKTRPTLEAMVAALQEAGDDEAAVMELFGKKMAESMLRQQAAQA